MTERKRKLESICEELFRYVSDLASLAWLLEDINFPDLADDLRMSASGIEDIARSAHERRV